MPGHIAMPPTSGRLFRLDGRVVLVVGGTSGLGEAIASGVAEYGATVIVASRSAGPAQRCRDGVAASVGVDVASEKSIAAMVHRVMADFGRIDVLVNSAGYGARCDATTVPRKLWDEALATNLTGTFLCCQAIGQTMIAARSGSIINIASVAGLVGLPGSVAYQASKGGVVQLTRSLAVEWAPFGVRVNALAPTQFDTPLVRRQWQVEPQLRDSFLAKTPMARIGDPWEIIGPALFLASAASSMITGHILTVDGGYTAQ